MRVAVFDLDGTLADTAADLLAAANGALSGAGVGTPLDIDRHRGTALRGGRAMLRAGLAEVGRDVDEDLVDSLYPDLLARYGLALDRETRLYPGVDGALAALDGAGWRLAVCTNKPEGLAQELLLRLGLRWRFAALLGADTLPVRKPDPRHVLETVSRAGGRRDRAVMVGDTATDRDAAGGAGIPCVLVSFGPEGEGVSRLAPEAILDHYDALPEILERLMPAKPPVG